MIRLVRAANPGPMTLEGTNTWLVGRDRVLVVDPGPDDDHHVRAVLDAVAGSAGRPADRLGGVLLTHGHPDHADALHLPRLQDALREAGAPVLAVASGPVGHSAAAPGSGGWPAPTSRPDAAALARATDEPVELLALPGHTADSVGLVVPQQRAVLTGDTVLGRGTSVVAHPDGDLGHYLASLELLLARCSGAPAWRGLPGHGPELPDLAVSLTELLAHRRARVEQVVTALATLPVPSPGRDDPDEHTVRRVVAVVYPEIDDEVLLAAAARTVRATLEHLSRHDGRRG